MALKTSNKNRKKVAWTVTVYLYGRQFKADESSYKYL